MLPGKDCCIPQSPDIKKKIGGVVIERGKWKKLRGKPPPLPLHPHHRSHMEYSRLTKLSYTHNVVFATG